jgi:hypothetical protein
MSELDRFVALLETCISGASRDPGTSSHSQLWPAQQCWLPDDFSVARACNSRSAEESSVHAPTTTCEPTLVSGAANLTPSNWKMSFQQSYGRPIQFQCTTRDLGGYPGIWRYRRSACALFFRALLIKAEDNKSRVKRRGLAGRARAKSVYSTSY